MPITRGQQQQGVLNQAEGDAQQGTEELPVTNIDPATPTSQTEGDEPEGEVIEEEEKDEFGEVVQVGEVTVESLESTIFQDLQVLQEAQPESDHKKARLAEVASRVLQTAFDYHGTEGCEVLIEEISKAYVEGQAVGPSGSQLAIGGSGLPSATQNKSKMYAGSPGSGSPDEVPITSQSGQQQAGQPGPQRGPSGQQPPQGLPTSTPYVSKSNPFYTPPTTGQHQSLPIPQPTQPQQRQQPPPQGPSQPKQQHYQRPQPTQPGQQGFQQQQYQQPQMQFQAPQGQYYYQPPMFPMPVSSKLPYHAKIPTFVGGPLGSGGLSAPAYLKRVEMETWGPEWTDGRRIQLAKENLSEGAKDRLHNAGRGGYTASWAQFRREFLAVFQFERGVILEYLEAFAPQRKEGEEVKAYLQRIVMELRNFTVDGEVMSAEEQKIRVRSICKRTLPREILAPLCDRNATLEEMIQGVDDLHRLNQGSLIVEKRPIVAGINSTKEIRSTSPTPTATARQKPFCLGCGKEGHYVGNCRVVASLRQQQAPQPRRNGEHSKQDRKLQCFGCGGNHLKVECKRSLGIRCHKCGRRNHMARVCRSQTKNGAVAGARQGQPAKQTQGTRPKSNTPPRASPSPAPPPQKRMPWHNKKEEEEEEFEM